MFFFKEKALSHKQTASVGLVLAVMSMAVTAIIVFLFPYFGAWLNNQGTYQLDIFAIVFVIVLFLCAQGVILFGFPLYYVQDKKSHMTGFRILLYAMGWMVVIMLLLSMLMMALNKNAQQSYSLDDVTNQSGDLIPVE